MRRAIVVVDYQNDFVVGALGSDDALEAGPRIRDRIGDCLDTGYDLFFTMDFHGSDYLSTREGSMLPVEHCIEGTWGAEIHPILSEYVGCGAVLRKTAFGCPELMSILAGYDEIEICGVATNICVMANAVIARTASPDARVVVRRDLVASYDRGLGEKALDVMASLQIEVL